MANLITSMQNPTRPDRAVIAFFLLDVGGEMMGWVTVGIGTRLVCVSAIDQPEATLAPSAHRAGRPRYGAGLAACHSGGKGRGRGREGKGSRW